MDIKTHELPTILAALHWWKGRKGQIPHTIISKGIFETAPPLSEDEIHDLIARLEPYSK